MVPWDGSNSIARQYRDNLVVGERFGELTRKMTAMTGFTSTAYVGETRILTLNEDKNRN